VIQERNGSNVPQVTYTRGSDLSGTLEGAGGIGGLLARSSGYSGGTGSWSTNHYYYADGNGNVTYVATSSQGLAASYRYDPFGNTISSSGSLADANIYRFSSKEILVNSVLYYYGYRFYDPNLQRWINRDPITEAGFILLASPMRIDPVAGADASTGAIKEQKGYVNLYTFEGNRPTLVVDVYGLNWRDWLPWNWPWDKILPPWNLPPPFPPGSTFSPWPPDWTNYKNPPGTLPFTGKAWRGFGFCIPLESPKNKDK
jgi:RHS repeat-associated protein